MILQLNKNRSLLSINIKKWHWVQRLILKIICDSMKVCKWWVVKYRCKSASRYFIYSCRGVKMIKTLICVGEAIELKDWSCQGKYWCLYTIVTRIISQGYYFIMSCDFSVNWIFSFNIVLRVLVSACIRNAR